MDSVTLIAVVSIATAGLTIGIGGIGPFAVAGEGQQVAPRPPALRVPAVEVCRAAPGGGGLGAAVPPAGSPRASEPGPLTRTPTAP